MRAIVRAATLVLGLAVTVAVLAAGLRIITATNAPGLTAGAPVNVLAHDPVGSSDPVDQVVQAFERLGFSCFQQRDFSYRDPDAASTLHLQDLAQKAGGLGHWLDAADHLGWIGTQADAIAQLNGTVIASDSTQSYVQTSAQGLPVAVTLRQVALPNGWSVWYATEILRPMACPAGGG